MFYSCIFITISTEIQSPYTTFGKVEFHLSEYKDIKWWNQKIQMNRKMNKTSSFINLNLRKWKGKTNKFDFYRSDKRLFMSIFSLIHIHLVVLFPVRSEHIHTHTNEHTGKNKCMGVHTYTHKLIYIQRVPSLFKR